MKDLSILDQGTLVGFRANTEAGDAFLEQCDAEGWQWFGPWLYVDHRCAGPLVEAAVADGLEVA